MPDAVPNHMYHERRLMTAEFDKVVRPNSDTLYSMGVFDLSSFDHSFTVPEYDDRFWLFSFYDMYVACASPLRFPNDLGMAIILQMLAA